MHSNSNWIFLTIVLCVLFGDGEAATCSSSDVLGNSNVQSISGSSGSSTEKQFIMTDNEYISPCCGVVTSWKIYASSTGTIVFQVWRPNGGGTAADLVGENSVSVTSTNTFTYNVAAANQLDIDTNDIIGWYSGSTDIVEYKFGGNRNDNNYVEDISQPNIGDTVSYNNQENDRTYAIYAELGPKPAPTLTNLDDTVNEYVSLVSTVTPIFTVTSSSVTATFTLQSITPSSHFSISSSTGEVTATTASVSATTYTLTISVAESCSSSNTGVLTIILANTAPVWSNLDATTSVAKTDVSTTTSSYTVIATNPVVNGSVSYSLQSITPSSHFTVHPTTGDVTATTSYVNGSTYTLVIRATDLYGNYVDGTLTLNVINIGPEINSLPDVADVSETAVDETLLHIVNVTDTDGDLVTCEMTPSPSGPFITKYLIFNDVFATGLYLQSSPNLDYSTTNAYELSATCSDGTASDTEILYVYVTKNNVPVITNLQNTTSMLSSTPTSTTIFQILSTDTEGDTTYFTLVCTVASSCPFSIYSDGSVVLTTSLISTTINGYELDITVYDDYSSSGTHRLTVFITDLNTQPDLYNLPATIQVNEDISIGTTVFVASVYDEDGDTSHTFTASFSPASSSGLFYLNSTTGELILASALNYLTQSNTYSITIQVSDAQTTSTLKILTIEVIDVNQAPVLYQINYQVDVDEGSAGTEAPDPGFNVYDADSDTLTYSWGGGDDTSGFSINTTNGIVSLTIEFDADDNSTDTLYVWLVVISDPEGLAATATLTVSILDTNDNVPDFSSFNYAAVISSSARVGTSVLTTTSTDADKTAENRELQFSIHSTSLFIIDHSGTIFVYQDLSSYVNTIESFIIRVRNPGVNSYDSANIAVSIEKFDDDDFFDNGANIAWVTLLCIFGPLVLIGLAYLGYLAYQKWVSSSVTTGQVTQVAPYDTRPPSYTPPKSRASMATRGTAVTPSDVRIINQSWEGWKADNW